MKAQKSSPPDGEAGYYFLLGRYYESAGEIEKSAVTAEYTAEYYVANAARILADAVRHQMVVERFRLLGIGHHMGLAAAKIDEFGRNCSACNGALKVLQFVEKAFVKRVNRRVDIHIVRFWGST